MVSNAKEQLLALGLVPGQIINGWEFVEMDLRAKQPHLGFAGRNNFITIYPAQIGQDWFVSLYEGTGGTGPHRIGRYALADSSFPTLAEAMAELETK